MTSPCASTRRGIFIAFGSDADRSKKEDDSQQIIRYLRSHARAPHRLRERTPRKERERERWCPGSGKNFSYLRASLFPRAAAYGYQASDASCAARLRATRATLMAELPGPSASLVDSILLENRLFENSRRNEPEGTYIFIYKWCIYIWMYVYVFIDAERISYRRDKAANVNCPSDNVGYILLSKH